MPYLADKTEKEILKFWEKDKTFQKSIAERPENQPYVFYDGPPFATGLPHYGHIVASLMKDVVPRYWTMRGYRVERVWGWDCHGLPIENIVEEKLGLKGKQDIEAMGIARFEAECRAAVLQYAENWERTVNRMGRWVDMEHAYKTMDIEYMESVWWVFSELWKKGLIEAGYKAMHICPHCVTPLSNFEVTQGYKDIKDISATVKFKLKNANEKLGVEGDIYALAWTTTPWTLPGNVALAIGEKIEYKLVAYAGEKFVVAKGRLQEVFRDKEYEVIQKVNTKDLLGLTYEPLFPYFKDTKNAFQVAAGEFVTTDEGTGIVHIAPAFGDDDYQIGQREEIGWVRPVTMEGEFTPEVVDFAGTKVKPKEDPTAADVEIIRWLAHHNKLFSKAKYEHSYPHCWRCDTPLLNYATSSWFVRVTALKKELIKNNAKTNWVPEHMKEGRFGKWLEGAKDWAISRNRFWGTPLPVWRCQNEMKNEKSRWQSHRGSSTKSGRKTKNNCNNIVVIGAVAELEKLTGKNITDLHKHNMDNLTFSCSVCGSEMRRIPEVLDCWFESGSMPYGQMHYPFENKKKFEAGFPAEFIAEGQDQTRGWFYTLHVLAAALTSSKAPSIAKAKSSPAFKNVIVNGIVLAEDGKKMSKRLKNYPDPMTILEKYGADAMRYYLVSSSVMRAENLNFSEAEVRDVYNRVINTLWNVFEFYQMFSSSLKPKVQSQKSKNVLDRWIMAKLQALVKEVTDNMNSYKLSEAARPIIEFVSELSQWYVRRSRDRFKGEDEPDKQFALATLRETLLTLAKIMAPFTPFIAERIHLDLTGHSVHLAMWPGVNEKLTKQNKKVLADMAAARKLVEKGLALRKEAKIKVRQPLAQLTIDNEQLTTEFKKIIRDEVNVKRTVIGKKLKLDTEITPELKKEGLARELARAINQIRKEKGLTRAVRVTVGYQTEDKELREVLEEFNKEIKNQVLASELGASGGGTETEINGKLIKLKIEL